MRVSSAGAGCLHDLASGSGVPGTPPHKEEGLQTALARTKLHHSPHRTNNVPDSPADVKGYPGWERQGQKSRGQGEAGPFPTHAPARVELLTAEPQASMTLGLLVISKRP